MSPTHKHIAVLGAARSGLAAARLAVREGAQVTLFDEGDTVKLAKSIETAAKEGLRLIVGDAARAYIVTPGEFDLAVLSPGFDVAWPLPNKFSQVGVPLTGELEFGYQRTDLPMIAITGTNGKSTTTELIAAVLNHCGKPSVPCGNHGMALSEVLTCGNTYHTLSLEVSSFQLETISTFKPHISMWLNFAPDHLDRYPDEASYFAAKYRIFENQDAGDFAIVNAQDVPHLGELRAKVITFSAYQPAEFEYKDGTFLQHGKVIGTSESLRLRGRHNMENVLATLAAGSLVGLEFPAMMEAIAAYEPPKHRCELVRTRNNVEFINDSKATNLHAMESCVRSLDCPIVLIVGGKEKGLDYSPLRSLLPGKVRALISIGEIGAKLATQFAGLLPSEQSSDMADAVTRAARHALPGDAVVLSPGTSSFDMYSGYAERGEHFRIAVQSLS